VKPAIFAIVLVAACSSWAQTPSPATLGEYSGLSRVRSDHLRLSFGRTGCPEFKAPYYYSGDFDPNNQYANGLSNEADTLVPLGSQVYQAFRAKGTAIKHHLKITGLCVNSIDVQGKGIDNPTPYEVRVGAKVGNGGRLVCTGMAISADSILGGDNQFNEHSHSVRIKNCIVPAPKKGVYYWINVEPQCFKGDVCSGQRYFNMSNDENLNHVGHITPPGMALWNSAQFGEDWVNPNTIFGDKTFLSFSQGVSAHLVK
jgi:hypothetical protein